jgi:hypothetical protein
MLPGVGLNGLRLAGADAHPQIVPANRSEVAAKRKSVCQTEGGQLDGPNPTLGDERAAQRFDNPPDVSFRVVDVTGILSPTTVTSARPD